MPEPDTQIDDYKVRKGFLGGVKRKRIGRTFKRSSAETQKRRKKIRVGMPKALNMWSTGPFWRTYFETLGLAGNNVVFSDDSSEEMWQDGGKYGSVDPCYPSKVAQAHIHNLLFHKHTDELPLQYIFFPCITHVPSYLEHLQDTAACPIVAGTPKVMQAAFTKEVDFFAQRGIEYVDTATTFSEPNYMKHQLFEAWGERLEITDDENDFAVDQAMAALRAFDDDLEQKGRAILEQVEEDNRMCLLQVGRPYHNDPGLNHLVTEEFQALGYPVISMRSVPKDPKWLARFFPDETRAGRSVLDIRDVWPENYSANSAQKVWSAKFAAHHPNVAVLDLSSFKCGHDAPTYGIIDGIITASNTAYSALHDIDANKPSGSIKIRVKTYAYSLGLREERLQELGRKRAELEARVMQRKIELLEEKQAQVIATRGERDHEIDAQLRALRNALQEYAAANPGQGDIAAAIGYEETALAAD
jgi:predicted nucleotide-binding protein (sugar kinase/HSP70/actin superfamily)